MSSRRLIAVLVVVASLGGPAAALAALTTSPDEPANVSQRPPVPLFDGIGKSSGDLPNTGADRRLLFLVGVALTMLGVGLRLCTADADLY